MSDQPGDDRPGPYSGLFGAAPDAQHHAQAYRSGPPKQVAIASVIAMGLGVLCLLLAVLALTSAGDQISEVLTGSAGNAPVAVAAAMVCAFLYLVPALYLRKRYAWARYVLIGVAAMGIAGGLLALPSGLLGLAIHATLLVLMLQRPTKLWFHHR